MPRSTYIYIAKHSGPWGESEPLAIFTVKHEAWSWIERYGADNVVLYRTRDGLAFNPVLVDG